MSVDQEETLEEEVFYARVFECIEQVIEKLGGDAKEVIYRTIESSYGLRRSQFASRPLEFLNHLGEVVGRPETAIIESRIAKELVSAFGIASQGSMNLLESIHLAKLRFMQT